MKTTLNITSKSEGVGIRMRGGGFFLPFCGNRTGASDIEKLWR